MRIVVKHAVADPDWHPSLGLQKAATLALSVIAMSAFSMPNSNDVEGTTCER